MNEYLEGTAQASPSLKWLPIESAPLDGTLIRLGFFRYNFFVGPGDGPMAWEHIGLYDAKDKPPLSISAWQTRTGQGFSFEPTYWRPLDGPDKLPAPTEEEQRAYLYRQANRR